MFINIYCTKVCWIELVCYLNFLQQTEPILDYCWVPLSQVIQRPEFLGKTISLEIITNDIYLGVASKQNTPFSKYALSKNVSKPTQCLEDAQAERDSKIILIHIFNK